MRVTIRLFLLLVVTCFIDSGLSLWPIPRSYDAQSGGPVLWFSPDARFIYNTPSPGANATIQRAIVRTRDQLFNNNLIPWMLFPRGTPFEPAKGSGVQLNLVNITQTKPDSPSQEYGQVDESYELSYPVAGGTGIAITAGSSVGVLHALTTLTQLFYAHSAGGAYSQAAKVQISDSPVYEHRGILVDLARQHYSKKFVLHILDSLSFNKMNRIHMHISDSQAWNLDIPNLPEISQKGAYRPGLSYSAGDLAEIQAYAADRGIQCILEIDMPGHIGSLWFSHPEHILAYNEDDWQKYAAEPPSGQIRLANSNTTAFVQQILKNLLPTLTSPYFHTGGDEVNKNVYTLEKEIASNNQSVITPFLKAFLVDNVHPTVVQAGKTPFVWEEMLLDWSLPLDKSAIVQVWLSDKSVYDVTKAGYRAVGGIYDYWYLDCGRGQWIDITPPSYAANYPFNDWCSPWRSWQLVYSYDPAQGISDPEQRKLVLGGEVHMWSETVDETNFDQIVWPRASAAAEVLWSGRVDSSGQNRTLTDASRRLWELRERMVLRGVAVGPIQAKFCELYPGRCEL